MNISDTRVDFARFEKYLKGVCVKMEMKIEKSLGFSHKRDEIWKIEIVEYRWGDDKECC